MPSRAPVPDSEVKVLKALALGACALFLLATPAAAHVAAPTGGSLRAQLRHHVQTLRHDGRVIRFFESHRWLLSDPRFRREATRQLESHRRHQAVARRKIAATREAIAVARCESRLQTWARNGEYVGLFQMGVSERLLFGHGESAEVQARAALRYFVASGRDWSPWGCKPWW